MPDFEGKPIRMRGFYRAVKRGDRWAVRIQKLVDSSPFAGFMALFYRNVDFRSLIYAKNPFMSMIEKKEDWGGKYLPIPYEVKK